MESSHQAPDRNLALELVRVTEAAAMAASRWMGRGDKEGADGAAVKAMRVVLQSVAMDGVVVIGEGEKDNAPMLFNGERIGDGSPPQTDIAVDPIDGTTPTALGRGGALAVIAVSERGSLFDPGPCVYMEKLAVGPRGRGAVDINQSPTENLHSLAKALGKRVRDLTAVILDRPRHADAHRRGAGVGRPHPAHHRRRRGRGHRHRLARGRGGRPLRDRRNPRGRAGRGGPQVHGRGDAGAAVAPRRRRASAALEAGYDLDAVLSTDDLVKGDNCFFAATGITDGELLQGVRYHDFGATTQSLVMRSKSGTLRKIDASHPSPNWPNTAPSPSPDADARAPRGRPTTPAHDGQPLGVERTGPPRPGNGRGRGRRIARADIGGGGRIRSITDAGESRDQRACHGD